MPNMDFDAFDALRDMEAALAAQGTLLQALTAHVFRNDVSGCRAFISELILSARFTQIINRTEPSSKAGLADIEAFHRRCVLAFRPLFESALRQTAGDCEELRR